MNWRIEKKRLPLKFTWKISRNSSEFKENYFVFLERDGVEAAGEIAFNTRYGETAEQIEEEFQRFLSQNVQAEDPGELHKTLMDMKLSRSLRFGLESAFVALLARQEGKSIAGYLGLKSREVLPTSFSLPILEVDQIEPFFQEHRLDRFQSLKIKVDADAEKRVREAARIYSGPLRIDANEAWQTAAEVMKFVDAVSDVNVEFIEQPLPAHLHDELKELRKICKIPLIADESLTDEGVSDYHAERFHGVNVKLMKAGGLLPALGQLNTARDLGLKTMLGCMVESSLGISKAIHISDGVDYLDLDGFLLLSEDPHQKVIEREGLLYLT